MRAAIVLVPFLAAAHGFSYRTREIHAAEPASISRHEVDLEFCRRVLAERRATWPKYLEFARRDPSNLSSLGSDALDIVQYASVVEPDSDEIPRMIRVAAQAFTGLFVVHRAAGKRIEWRVGNETFVYEGRKVDESIRHASRWLQAFQLALICRDEKLLDALCETRSEELRKSSTVHAEYFYFLMDGLRAHWTEAEGGFQSFLEALRRTDAKTDKSLDFGWTLWIDVPLIEVTARCLTDDQARFNDALRGAVKLHKEYYSATEERRDDRRGFLSIALLAMAAYAHDRGIRVEVASDYLPERLLRGDCFKEANAAR